ncbi:MAG: aminotransferase class V-fold PLP-dependent enzyme [Lachnospiraceae bacterium]|jgi:cysteine desulfurase family protein|nr:aminotransferase class V-fold PLP-dependent enzyme [Lachnospiraceae bacterium]
MIYLDNAATSLIKPKEVAEGIMNALNSLGNAGRGNSSTAMDAARTIYDCREKLASLFNAEDVSRIVFTSNSTEALNIGIQCGLSSGDKVLTSVLEHNSIIRPLHYMEEKGVNVTYVGADKLGNINYDELFSLVDKDTKMVILTHASNLTGNLVDIANVGNIIKDINPNVLFLVDASQTAGVYEIDVQKCKIDILCFTGHKGLLGPQGTGGMYVRTGVKLRPFKLGGTGVETYNPNMPEVYPTHLEAGTLNGHGIAGLLGALNYLEKTGIENIREKELEYMWQFYNGIKDTKNITIYGDFNVGERAPVVTFNIGNYDSAEVADTLLNDYNIICRAGGHCAPKMHESLGNKDQGAVRFSFSHNNTKEEIETAIKAVNELAKL